MELLKDSKILIDRLNSCGYQAYAVGGAVRDFLMGVTNSDIDLTTSATPNEMLEIFKDYKVILTGAKHGTVTVVLNGKNYEITTFRKEGGYLDNRHPDSVEYITDLKEDLKRRDFTINAMAYSQKDGVIDIFNGKRDLENKIIRAVGNADTRFKEDALRILRALRFASTLNFKIEEATAKAIIKNAPLLKNVAVERVYSELCGILLGKGVEEVLLNFKEVFFVIIPELKKCDRFLQKSKYHAYDVYTHTVKSVALSQNDLTVRLALLFHDIEKPNCFSISSDGAGHFYGHQVKSSKTAELILKRFKADNKTTNLVTKLIYLHDTRTELSRAQIKRQMAKYGSEFLAYLTLVRIGDALAHAEPYIEGRVKSATKYFMQVDDILKKGECYTLKQLEVNGQDVKNLGYKGEQISQKLNYLLDAVIDGKVENSKAKLLEYLNAK
ncbi:MAG: CCA tRNA nucleotidyltransferase [Clostridia bacterium]|nr:CCA tRNA nucleotidyltransferase [Clostridia bacterium]